MNTTLKHISRRRSRAFLLSIICAGLVATFLGGCAEGPYVTAYDNGHYYPTAYYTPGRYDYYYGYPYYYYGNRTAVRYYDPYGRRYYSYWY